LQMLMAWPAPRYVHHPLLTDATGRRLAKRDQAVTLRTLRERGVSREAAWRLAGWTGGRPSEASVSDDPAVSR
jgi:glutamyl-Q tRNA(Asp) synthetase